MYINYVANKIFFQPFQVINYNTFLPNEQTINNYIDLKMSFVKIKGFTKFAIEISGFTPCQFA